jgi:hypothetical protein
MANALVRRKFQNVNALLILASPTICTPEDVLLIPALLKEVV